MAELRIAQSAKVSAYPHARGRLMQTNQSDNSGLRALIWTALLALALLIGYAELFLTISLWAAIDPVILHAYNPQKNQESFTVYFVLRSVYALIMPGAFGCLNAMVIATKAGKFSKVFAQCFAIQSLLWLFLGVKEFIAVRQSFAFTWQAIARRLPGFMMVMAGLLQIRFCLQIAQAHAIHYKTIDQLESAEKQVLEQAIHEMKTTESQDECLKLASRCLRILAIKETHQAADDMHALTKELARQNRREDAQIISNRYVQLVEKNLLPP